MAIGRPPKYLSLHCRILLPQLERDQLYSISDLLQALGCPFWQYKANSDALRRLAMKAENFDGDDVVMSNGRPVKAWLGSTWEAVLSDAQRRWGL